RAAPHLLDDHERRQVVEIGFAAPGRSGGADLAVDVQPRAENRRVADAAWNLPRQPARRRHAADLAFRVDAVAVDRAVVVIAIDPAFRDHLPRDGVIRLLPILWREIVQRIDPPLP